MTFDEFRADFTNRLGRPPTALDAWNEAQAAERETLDRTILELIDLWGTHGNAALIAGDAATSNAWAAAVATVRDVSAAIRAERA